jgi:hypothetical protein
LKHSRLLQKQRLIEIQQAEGLHGVHKRLDRDEHPQNKGERDAGANRRRGCAAALLRKKKRGYMVCTSDYVATNTRKQQTKAARSSAGKTGCHPKEANPKKASVRETALLQRRGVTW